MKYALLIILSVALLNCTGDDLSNNIDVPLEGKWIDVDMPSNIVTFKQVDGKKMMILERGTEIRDGHVLPKMGSGYYDYDLLSDEVLALRSTLSSNSNFHEYYFERSGNILTVDKFFEIETPGERLTFMKAD